MAISRLHDYLICYDISCPRRLQRVHRCLVDHAIPLQYSVFRAEMTEDQLKRLIGKIKRLINNREDDVRFYRLQDHKKAYCLGKPLLPEGVMLL